MPYQGWIEEEGLRRRLEEEGSGKRRAHREEKCRRRRLGERRSRGGGELGEEGGLRRPPADEGGELGEEEAAPVWRGRQRGTAGGARRRCTYGRMGARGENEVGNGSRPARFFDLGQT